MPPLPPEEAIRRTRTRIAAKSAASTERSWNGTPCVEWQGAVNRYGYGRVLDTRTRSRREVYRVNWELEVGDVPEGLELDHLCRNRLCLSLLHLEQVTHAENVRRRWAAQIGKRKPKAVKDPHAPRPLRALCRNGHPYDEQNTARHSQGHRVCRACRAAYRKKWRANQAKEEEAA